MKTKQFDRETILTVILMIVLLFWFDNALALRCGTVLIDDNMPLHEVQQACAGGTEYQVQNQNADIVKYYYNDSGMNHEMIFIDGNLKGIESNR